MAAAPPPEELGPPPAAGAAGPLPPALALGAGLASALGFGHGAWAGFGWLLPLVGLAVLFRLLAAASARRALLLGWLFGLGHFGLGVSWTHASLHVHGGLTLPLALAIAWAFCAFLALFYGLAAWAGTRLGQPGGMRLLATAALWILFENLRTWLFGGFGWLAAGYAQVPSSPLSGYVPFFGVFGATAMVAVLAALLAGAAWADDMRRTLALTAAALLAGGWMLRNFEIGIEVRDGLSVSVIQGAVPQERQWLDANVHELPGRYLELLEQAQGKLKVAPESALPFAWSSLPESDRERFERLPNFGEAIVLGMFTRDESSGRIRNSAAVLSSQDLVLEGKSAPTSFYSKRKLTPYGEYLPFARLLEPVLRRNRIPYANLQPGDRDGYFDLLFTRIDVSICYESLFPRLFAGPLTELLVTITNDSWFDGTAMAAQHLQIAAGRALERRRFMLRASNTGPSAVIRPDGTLATIVAPGVMGVAEAAVELRAGATPYMRWGDAPVLAATLLLVAFLAVAALWQRTALLKG